jgi:hypothetical protein
MLPRLGVYVVHPRGAVLAKEAERLEVDGVSFVLGDIVGSAEELVDAYAVAMRGSIEMSGMLWPHSHLETAALVIPRWLATSSCVRPCAVLREARVFARDKLLMGAPSIDVLNYPPQKCPEQARVRGRTSAASQLVVDGE